MIDDDDSIDLSSQPNDAYFKAVFSDTGHASVFFQNHLPPALAAKIDWLSLTLLPGSFVKRSLQQAYSDLLFSTVIATSAGSRSVLLYLLFEHQTSVDATMPLRLLAYILEIYLTHQKQHGLPLPVLIPFVLHQGPDTWTVSPHFEDLLNLPPDLAPDLLPYVPKFTHALLDLSSYEPTKAEAEPNPSQRIVLQLMKLARGKRLLDFFQWLVKEGVEPLPITIVRLSLMYAMHAMHDDDQLDLEKIYHTLQSNPNLKEQIMSIAEKLIAQGEARGKAEGQARGEIVGKLRLLQELMKLPVSRAEELEGFDIAELQVRFHELQLRYEAQFKNR